MRLQLAAYRTGLIPFAKRASWWRIMLTLALCTVAQIIATAIIYGVAAALIAGPDGDFDRALDGLRTFSGPQAVLVFLSTFIGPVLALWLSARLLHGLRFRDLVGLERRILLSHFFGGVAVVALVAGAGVALSLAFSLVVPNLPVSRWLTYLPAALALILLQITAEELVFRGYLQPQLAARYRSPLVWLVLPALLFGCLHYRPGAFGSNAWLVVLAATLMGIIAGHVTARTGNISAAMGLHFANNCVGLLIVAVPGDLAALALYLHPVDLGDPVAFRGMLIGNIGTIIGAYGIYLWVLRRRDARLQ